MRDQSIGISSKEVVASLHLATTSYGSSDMMKGTRISKSIFALVLAATTLLARPHSALCQVGVGSAAPEFTAKDSTGKDVSLSAFKGKIVVLEWFNPNCPFVKKFYKNGDMQKFQETSATKGVVWLTVNSSASGRSGHLSPQEAEETRKELNMKSTALILDEDGKVGKAFGARTTPHMYIVGTDGKIAYAGAIDSEASTSSDDIAGATNYVTAAVDGLVGGKPVEVSSTEPYGCSVKY
jgi:peroxiredoxin